MLWIHAVLLSLHGIITTQQDLRHTQLYIISIIITLLALTATASRPDVAPSQPLVTGAIDSVSADVDTTVMTPQERHKQRTEMMRRSRERYAAAQAARDSANEARRDSLRLSAQQRQRVSLNDEDSTEKKPTGRRISRVKSDLDNVVDISEIGRAHV